MGTVVTVLAVFFLGQVVGGESGDLQGTGIAVAVVIAALTYFLAHLHHDRSRGGRPRGGRPG